MLGVPVNMAALSAQDFGRGMEEDGRVKGKAQRKVRLLKICERSIAGEKQSGCDRVSLTAKIWIGLTGALDVLVEWKGATQLERRDALEMRMGVGRQSVKGRRNLIKLHWGRALLGVASAAHGLPVAAVICPGKPLELCARGQ